MLEIGNTVKLKSSPLLMTVIALPTIGNYMPANHVKCAWFDINYIYRDEVFPNESLEVWTK